MNHAILTILASDNYWANKYAREATYKQTETIKQVGIAIVVVLVILIIVIALKKTSKKARERQDDAELKDQLKELLEQNKKLTDEVEKLKQDSKKKGKE